MILLNLGCGEIRPKGWINTDSSLNSLFQRMPILGNFIPVIFKSRRYDSKELKYMNLNSRWKFKKESVDVVYSSHVFEHLKIKSAHLYLSETYRVLKKEGVIRIVLPDLFELAKNYVSEVGLNTKEASKNFLWSLNLHKEGQYNHENLFSKLIHLAEGYPHQHKYMYNKIDMKILLEQYQFRHIHFSTFAQSKYIDNIKEVEYREWGIPSIYIEALK